MKKLVLILILICFLLTGCQGVKKKELPPLLIEPVSVNVDLVKVTREDICDLKVYSGSVIPYTENLAFGVSGNIGEINVKLGDTVEKDQVLATLYVSEINSQIEALEKQIAHMKETYEYENSLMEYDIKILMTELEQLEENINAENIKEDNIDKKLVTNVNPKEIKQLKDIKGLKLEIEIKKADIKILQTELSQAKALQEYELNRLQQKLDELLNGFQQSEIIAPFSGQIFFVADINGNEKVEADSVIIGIADHTRKYVKCEYITDSSIESSKHYYARYDNNEIKVSHIPMDKTEQMKTIFSGGVLSSTFLIEPINSEVQIGDFINICIEKDSKNNCLVIPPNGIYTDKTEKYVYLYKDGKKIRQNIEVGITTNSFAEITEGLLEGDEVYVQN